MASNFTIADAALELQACQEHVPIQQVLIEVGFRADDATSDNAFSWTDMHRGLTVRFTAYADWFGLWTITCRAIEERTWWDMEQRVLANESRGRFIQILLGMWQEIHGRQSLPEALRLGLVYRQHRRDLSRTVEAMPEVMVDGDVMRATRRWLRRDRDEQRQHVVAGEPGISDQPLLMEAHGGLLQLVSNDRVYGVPCMRGWMDPCTVSLDQFLELPAWLFRGSWIRLRWCPRMVQVQGREELACREKPSEA